MDYRNPNNLRPEKDSADKELNRLLSIADPASDSNLDEFNFGFEESLQRITNQLNPPSLLNDQSSANLPTIPWLTSRFVVLAASVTGISLVGFLLWHFGETSDRPPNISQSSKPHNILESTKNPKREPIKTTRTTKTKKKLPLVQTADAYLALSPTSRWKARKRIDQDALREELGKWLEAWHESEPQAKKTLEQTFVKNRFFWGPLVQQTANHWKKSIRNRACLAILVLTKDPIATYKLRQARKTPAERHYCNELLFPILSDQQLADEIQNCKSCADLDQFLNHLAGRDHPSCTQVAINIAGTRGCSTRIAAVSKWNNAHIQKAFKQIGTNDRNQQTATIQFLVQARSRETDRILARSLQERRNTLPLLQVLLSRNTPETEKLKKAVFQTRSLAAYIPSARMAITKTKLPYNKLSQKVCQSCLNP